MEAHRRGWWNCLTPLAFANEMTLTILSSARAPAYRTRSAIPCSTEPVRRTWRVATTRRRLCWINSTRAVRTCFLSPTTISLICGCGIVSPRSPFTLVYSHLRTAFFCVCAQANPSEDDAGACVDHATVDNAEAAASCTNLWTLATAAVASPQSVRNTSYAALAATARTELLQSWERYDAHPKPRRSRDERD